MHIQHDFDSTWEIHNFVGAYLKCPGVFSVLLWAADFHVSGSLALLSVIQRKVNHGYSPTGSAMLPPPFSCHSSSFKYTEMYRNSSEHVFSTDEQRFRYHQSWPRKVMESKITDNCFSLKKSKPDMQHFYSSNAVPVLLEMFRSELNGLVSFRLK